MLKSVLGGLIGIGIGHYIPPGSVFWCIVGTISGYLLHRYSNL